MVIVYKDITALDRDLMTAALLNDSQQHVPVAFCHKSSLDPLQRPLLGVTSAKVKCHDGDMLNKDAKV